MKYQVTPRVLKNKNKGARSILDELESLIRVCKAGFILATPDDEGHLRGSSDPLAERARENVIFETGLLFAKFREFERVAVLLKRPLKLPTDLDGIVYELSTMSGTLNRRSKTSCRPGASWPLAERLPADGARAPH